MIKFIDINATRQYLNWLSNYLCIPPDMLLWDFCLSCKLSLSSRMNYCTFSHQFHKLDHTQMCRCPCNLKCSNIIELLSYWKSKKALNEYHYYLYHTILMILPSDFGATECFGHASLQNPYFFRPVMWFPFRSTLVEHHVFDLSSGSIGHP